MFRQFIQTGGLATGEGGRQKLVRGRWRAAEIVPRAMAGGKNWSAGGKINPRAA